jgi:hypothetical protein
MLRESLWRPQTYPPRGPFPHFGDQTLRDTMGATEQAHRSLVEKRQQRQQEHAETLQYHGLMPDYYDISDPTEEQGTQTEAGVQASSDGGTEPEPMDTGSWEPMESGSWGPVRTRRPRSSPMTGTRVPHVVPQVASQEPQEMEDDTSTVNYEMSEAGTVDYGPLEIDDQEMRTSTKRMAAEDEEKKKKLRAMPPPKPKVKREALAIPAAPAPAATQVPDDEVQVSAIQPNKSSDMAYWKEQSANELRKELKLRDLQRFRDEWAFKSKDQLLEIIRGLIQAGTW